MSHLRRKSVLSKIVETDAESPRKMSNDPLSILSPISSIVRDLNNSTLSIDDSPKCHNVDRLICKRGVSEKQNQAQEGAKKGMFKNAFNIRGTPEGPINTKPRGRRLLAMATRQLSDSETMSPSADIQNNFIALSPCSSSPHKNIGRKMRYPLEDCDPNSRDDGYFASYAERSEKSRKSGLFATPLGVAPRRLSLDSRSPMQSPVRASPKHKRPAVFRSLSSGYESMEDDYNELIDMDALEQVSKLPNGITSLITGQIVSREKLMEWDVTTTPENPRKTSAKNLRRSLSLQHGKQGTPENNTPPMSKVRSCLFRSPNATSSVAELTFNESTSANAMCIDSPTTAIVSIKSFKRPEPPTDASPILVKRSRKCASFEKIEITPLESPVKKTISESEAHTSIKLAVQRSTTDTDLTGDFSKPCILPLAEGQHDDLKSISADTLAGLIRGDFDDQVSTFKIVDCRYPYEYEGGHIKGAVNLYNKDLVSKILLDPLTHTPEIQPDTSKRSIVVFHCEFSWERGPNLSRFLRSIDRQRNKEHYPALHYPEVYLLHGGYEQFYKLQKEYCFPQGYRPMRHPDNEADLKQFRSKSKSWQGERTKLNGLTARANLKRLGF